MDSILNIFLADFVNNKPGIIIDKRRIKIFKYDNKYTDFKL